MLTYEPGCVAPKAFFDASPHNRVVGWDLLRGICALSVAIYHLLSWLDIAHLYPLGLYGVYIFFVLSGASLTFTYSSKTENRCFSFSNFLFARYLRLAPLYLLLLIFSVPWKLKNEGLDIFLMGKLVSNVFFSFGLYKPVGQSMLVGGWSLGIEFLFLDFRKFISCAYKNSINFELSTPKQTIAFTFFLTKGKTSL